MKPLIFISSVSRELRTARQLVANTLIALGYEPVWQDIFETSPDDLREMLRKKIDSCSAVLQIVGHAYGAEPPTPDETFGRCSYTQYEALYARSRKKPVYYLIAENDLPRDAAAETIDTPVERTPTSVPPGPGGPGYGIESTAAQADAAERQRLQSVYRQGVLTAEQVYYPVHNHQDTELSVRRLRDDLSKLRRGFQRWMVGVTAALVLIASGIAWLKWGQKEQVQKIDEAKVAQQELAKSVEVAQQKTTEQIAATGQKTHEQMQEVASAVTELTNPVILAERIRKEIHATAEEKIKALPDEKGRGRLIAEIEKERDLALGRVDDLIKLIQEGLKEGASPVFQRAAEILKKEGTDEALAYLESRRPSTLETARRHAEQAKTAQARADAEKELRNKSLQALVLEAELLETKLQWEPALKLREQVAELAPDWFEARNSLGLLHLTLARFGEAELQLRASVRMAATPSEEARSLSGLALLLQATNRLAEAEPLMRRSLAINEYSDGTMAPIVSPRLNNLGMLLQITNRLAEAEILMRRALAIDEKSYGLDHHNVSVSLTYLGQVLHLTNRLVEAEPLMRRALAINEQSFGTGHPSVAGDINNLAALLQDANRSADAEPLLRRAIAIDEQFYGAGHFRIAIELNNLAVLLKTTNRLAESEPLMRRALAIDEQTFGTGHPAVARDLNNLAQLLKTTNRLTEAEPLMRRALTIDERSYGAEHADVARDLHNLAQLLWETNRLAKAEPLMHRSVEIFHRFGCKTGHQHPHTETVVGTYRDLLRASKLPPDEIVQRVKRATASATVTPLLPIESEVERLLGPARLATNVLTDLDREYKAEGMPEIYFLKPDQPIAPHLDELCKPSPSSLTAAGISAFRKGDYADAIALYDESLKLLADKPDDVATAFTIRMNCAAALRELGELEQARDDLRKLLAEQREGDTITALAKGRALYHLALCEWRLNDREVAQREAEESLKAFGNAPAGLFAFIGGSAKEAEIAPFRKQTEQLLADLKDNKTLPLLANVDAVAALEQARARFRARAELATLPLNQSALPLLDQMLGPAKTTQEVFEELDRQYREQNKPAVWFLPLSEPISPQLDELLGPVPAQDIPNSKTDASPR